MTGPLSNASRLGRSSGLLLWPLWIGAAALMLVVHGAAGWALREWRAGEPPTVTQEASPIIIDLPPLAVAPETPPQETAPAIEPEAAQDTPVETAQPQPPQTAQVQTIDPPPPPDASVETPQPVQPDTAQAEPIQPVMPEPLPDIPAQTEKTQQAEVVMPAAKPKKKAAPRKTEKPQATKTGPDIPAPRTPQAATPAAPAGPSPSEVAAWQASVSGRIDRAVRSVTVHSNGTARVIVSISPSGQILSVKISQSSGNAQQDADAAAAIRRIGDFPAPPAGTKSARSVIKSINFKA